MTLYPLKTNRQLRRSTVNLLLGLLDQLLENVLVADPGRGVRRGAGSSFIVGGESRRYLGWLEHLRSASRTYTILKVIINTYRKQDRNRQ